MFGYVLPPLKGMDPMERDRFQRTYCGLCHTLGQRYGLAARFVLNYDFTYLAILLSDGEEAPPCCARCPASPLKQRCYQPSTPAMELAADESVILAYWQLRDAVADRGFWGGLGARCLSCLLRPAYQKAQKARPRFDESTQRQLRCLSALEAAGSPEMDRAAEAFAQLLQGAAEEVSDPVRRRVLSQMLYHLGRWVYLIDAADDLKKDAASGNYNPVALRFRLKDGAWTPESRQEFVQTLDESVHMIATAFELWDFGCWQSLLERTIYTGFFQVGRAVLDGTFRVRKKHKKDEETK